MEIIRKVSELTDYVASARHQGRSIGLVPTMGAIHDGHLSLVHRSVADNDITLVTLFVNPVQFNNPADLESYPRTEEADFRLLAQAGASAVFAPTVDEIYPEGVDSLEERDFGLGTAAEVMEGKHRPGHFEGVARIVSRLFELSQADRAYFGEKDFQQIAVIRNMTTHLHLPVEIIACPIKREEDGLAMSSRNALLTPEQRALAPEIHRALTESVSYSQSHSVRATHDTVVERLDAVPGFKVEYFEIVDARTLLPIDEWEESPWVVGCITVYNGKVRLIDNITYRKPE